MVCGLGKRARLLFIEIDSESGPGFLDGAMAIDHAQIAGKRLGQMECLKRHLADQRKVLFGFCHLLKDRMVQREPLMQSLFQFISEFLFA